MVSMNRYTNRNHLLLYMLDGKKIVKCENPLQWHDWMAGCDIADRCVARTEKDGICVSTVFTGVDCYTGFCPPGFENLYPEVFETAIFKDGSIMDKWNYCSWDEAEKGHKEVCKIAGV